MPGWPDAGRLIVQGPLFRRLLKRISAETSDLRIILNAGAGEGLFSPLLLSAAGLHLLAEIDQSYHPPSRRPDTCQKIVTSSVTAIPFAMSTFDLVLCTEVLEHVEDDGRALDEMRRVLRPGGWLLITVPTPPAVYDPAHVREGYGESEMRRMLTTRGLDVIEVGFCMHAAFKLLMRRWRRLGRMRQATIFALALADRVWPMGRPMDLIVLSRLPLSTDKAKFSDCVESRSARP
ncbi:MAG: class I SAM-dependent methyltransferase [Candidatus Binataceae bacterium]